MDVWVEIGDAPPGFVVLKKSATTIFHLMLAIKSQRSNKFLNTDADDIIVKRPTATGVTERINPAERLNFGTDRGSSDFPFVVGAPTGISTLNPFIILLVYSV